MSNVVRQAKTRKPIEPTGLARPVRETDEQLNLFGFGPSWETHWWGMPEFTMGDATPQYRITINFMTAEDVKDFASRLGLTLGGKSDTAWYPPQKLDEPKRWAYVED